MFVRTSRQRGLFESELMLSDGARALLKESWAEQFAARVLPLLLKREGDLAPLYASDKGRPNWSAARMLGLCVLREMSGLGSDRETVESLAFDARFQHALGLAGDAAYLSRRSLVDFRRRLAQHDPDGVLLQRLFDEVARAAIDDMGLSTTTQRCDSTFVMSNIALRGRTALLSEALERLLLAVKEAGRIGEVTADVVAWFDNQEGWDSKVSFAQLARWLYDSLSRFRSDERLSQTDAYRLASGVFRQHVRVRDEKVDVVANADTDEPDDPDDDAPRPRAGRSNKEAKGRAKAKAQRKARRNNRTAKAELDETTTEQAEASGAEAEASSAEESDFAAATEHGVERIQSLHDLDARLGHKGTGYHAQLVETSNNEGKPEVITHVSVVPANANDCSCLPELMTELSRKQLKPSEILVDAGYISADTLVNAAREGVELIGPAKKPTRVTALTRNDFSFDEDGHVVACPCGHAPIGHGDTVSSMHRKRQLHVYFDADTCRACPSRGQCPVREKFRGKQMELCISEGLRRRDQRLKEQATPEFRERYSARSGIEATASELKRAHELRRLTVRGRKKAVARVTLKATACNVKRWTRYRAQQAA